MADETFVQKNNFAKSKQPVPFSKSQNQKGGIVGFHITEHQPIIGLTPLMYS